ncbi:hypothetical protein GCM10010124_29770 [Pilimelia terevasa]|uniref:Uncharacterized protein n=1 Tax=Pilimelia terevasa TaxID=53372 RepID=A0A8J3BS59_9ACTN|nr:hypothetical protein GCM10010124_29770 [Pilimelia terevasa]
MLSRALAVLVVEDVYIAVDRFVGATRWARAAIAGAGCGVMPTGA